MQSIIYITLVNICELLRSGNQCRECNGMETRYTKRSGHIRGLVVGHDCVIIPRRSQKYIPLTEINSKTEKDLNVLWLGLDVDASVFENDFSTWKPHIIFRLGALIFWFRLWSICCWGRLWIDGWSLQSIIIDLPNCFNNNKAYLFFELFIYGMTTFLYGV